MDKKLLETLTEPGITKEEYNHHKDEIKYFLRDFMEYTATEDYLGIMLRATVYLENDMNTLLELLLLHPKKIKLPYFTSKVDALYAIGAISEEWIGPYRKIGKLRNKYAHNYKFEFTQKDFDDLISTLSSEAKKEYQENLKNEESVLKIIKIIGTPTYDVDLKYKLRLLLSDMMLYLNDALLKAKHTRCEFCMG